MPSKMNPKLASKLIEIDGATITSWRSFHSVFKSIMGFPDFYGANMNAWIDCMTCVDEPDDAMSKVHAPEEGVLVIHLKSAKSLKKRCPELFETLVEATALVNFRRIEMGSPPVLMLSFFD